MGETQEDRGKMLMALANLPQYPESVPINKLVPIPGTPLGDAEEVHPLDFVRTIAAARIMMPKAMLRLSAGRRSMSDELQALCFLAGANSIFVGDRLLTTNNVEERLDDALFEKLGIEGMPSESESAPAQSFLELAERATG